MSKDIEKKIDEISEKFKVIKDFTQEVETVPEIIDTSKYPPEQVMKLQNMIDDFEANRKILQKTVMLGETILEKLSQKLLIDKEDISLEDAEMFKALSEIVLDCTRASSDLYHEFSKVLLNIKKVNESGANQVKNVTNNLNIKTENINPVELIEKLRNS